MINFQSKTIAARSKVSEQRNGCFPCAALCGDDHSLLHISNFPGGRAALLTLTVDMGWLLRHLIHASSPGGCGFIHADICICQVHGKFSVTTFFIAVGILFLLQMVDSFIRQKCVGGQEVVLPIVAPRMAFIQFLIDVIRENMILPVKSFQF